jgi:dolichol-phosphate mannosyltransferase
MIPETLIIIPTYNERENIENLTKQILSIGGELHILIIDDNSPDGTGEIGERLAAKHARVHIISRKTKLGLGTAYVEGFRFALKNGFQYVFTMDADFSHDPEHLSQIFQGLDQYNVVIGSRYIPGGCTVNWDLLRRLISKGGNFAARSIVRLKPHDCTSGYRGYRREVLEKIEFGSIKSSGYSFLVEMLFLCQKNGFLIGEIPIVFVDRKYGYSKISKAEIYKAFFTLLRLSFSRFRS